MKFLLLTFGLFLVMGEAKAYLAVDLNEVCANNSGDPIQKQTYKLNNSILEFSQRDLDKFCSTPEALQRKKDWHLKIYFGPFLAYYNETEMALQRDGKNIQLSHVNPKQRHSMAYYDLRRYNSKWTESHNPGQIFDEPQNRLTVEYQSDAKKFNIGIEYIHPKILFYNNENQEEFTKGNPEIQTNLGTDEKPEYLASVATTKSNVIINLYLNKRFELVNLGKDKFKVEYIAGAGIGFHGSESMFQYRDQYYNHLPSDEKWNVQGFSGNVQNRLEFSSNKSRVSLRLGHDLVFIRYDAKEANTSMKTNIWGQFVSAQIGIRIK